MASIGDGTILVKVDYLSQQGQLCIAEGNFMVMPVYETTGHRDYPATAPWYNRIKIEAIFAGKIVGKELHWEKQ